MSSYIADEMVVVSQKEADAYYDACNELYDMFVETAEEAIQNDRFFELDIPNAPFPWSNRVLKKKCIGIFTGVLI